MSPVTELQRRVLLRHLGDVLEATSCLAACGMGYPNVAAAVEAEDSLSGLAILGMVAPDMQPNQFIERAGRAFMLWPNTLLAEEVNCPLLAYMVKHDLFDDNEEGWERYVNNRRVEIPWFGESLPRGLSHQLRIGRDARFRR